MIWVLLGAIWFVLGFLVWAFLKVGADYREPISEADIQALRDEAERVVRLGDQNPFAHGNGYVVARPDDFKASHSTNVAARGRDNHA